MTVVGKVRPRSRIFGQLRVNGVGGFIAAGVERNIGRVRLSNVLTTFGYVKDYDAVVTVKLGDVTSTFAGV